MIGDIMYFPIWWYTRGILLTFSYIQDGIRMANEQFVPWLWFTHLFVPMYGQYDWQGRIMSVFIRTLNVCVRSMALILWSVIVVLLGLLWISLPLMSIMVFIWSIV